MRIRDFKRGATLIEIMVAIALFMVAGLILISMFQWGLKSLEVGKLNMSAQQAARDAMRAIKEELGTAMRLSLSQGANTPRVPSPVLLPSAVRHHSENELIFVTAIQKAASMDSSRTENYRLVRYVVDGVNVPNTLVKEVYDVNMSNGSIVFAATEQALPCAGTACSSTQATAGNHWFVDTSKLGVPKEQLKIVSLDGSNDQITFKVQHARVDASKDPFYRTFPDPMNANPSSVFPAGTPFDRLVFRIDVDVMRYYRNSRNDQSVKKSLQDSVTIPDFG